MDWLATEILTGFQKLLCLGLDRTPAADLIQGTVMAWREVLTDGRSWDEDRDRERIRKAFITLARTRRQWPAPVDFLEAIPRYIPELKALPRKPADPERARRAMEELARELGVDRKTQAAGGGRD